MNENSVCDKCHQDGYLSKIRFRDKEYIMCAVHLTQMINIIIKTINNWIND